MYWVFYNLSDTKDPMAEIEEEIILKWCDDEPQKRYATAASLIIPYRANGDMNTFEWTALAKQFILRAPDPKMVEAPS
ncbi:hypothetical protein [Cohnella sp. WQ 127256]|uniref:hypothetical protein n=1 Tax=Cohnella sp. WQ 127256 TaxID=2938790 RepID=UPI00211784EA|nr:hypothetical protein [Cohnella sp. WQ 127256]